MFLTNCNSANLIEQKKEILNENFTDITNLISLKEFEKIKEFVLKNGGRKSYRNFDSNNPHYRFLNCDVYFGADIGQKNIQNNPELSDFNELTIADWNSTIRYYELIIVRQGDIKAKKAWLQKGMIEQRVYLVDTYGKGLELIKNNLSSYLTQIKKEVTANNKEYKK